LTVLAALAIAACSSAPPRPPCHPADEMACLPAQDSEEIRKRKLERPLPPPPRVPGPR